MAEHTTLASLFSDIANSIRAKLGSSDTFVADEFPSKIDEIEVGVDVSDTTATASDVRDTKYFHTADGTGTQGTLHINTLTPSSSGVAITSGSTYEASAGGYAINNYVPVVPSINGEFFNSGFKRMASSGYAYSVKPIPDWKSKGVSHIAGPRNTQISISTGLSNITEFYASFQSDDASNRQFDIFGYTNGRYWYTNQSIGGEASTAWTSAASSAIRPSGISGGNFNIYTPTNVNSYYWTGNVTWYAK